jgi:hypothetical protein
MMLHVILQATNTGSNMVNMLHLLTLLFPLVVGYLARGIMQGLKYIQTVDNWPAWAKQLTVVVISASLALLGAWVGVDFGVGLDGVTEAGLTTILSAIFAMVTHNGSKLAAFRKDGSIRHQPSGNPGRHYGLAIVCLLAYGIGVFAAACARGTP